MQVFDRILLISGVCGIFCLYCTAPQRGEADAGAAPGCKAGGPPRRSNPPPRPSPLGHAPRLVCTSRVWPTGWHSP